MKNLKTAILVLAIAAISFFAVPAAILAAGENAGSKNALSQATETGLFYGDSVELSWGDSIGL